MLVLIVAAILVGMTLGLLGSGGSAITVPLLVYVVGHSGKPAIAESLAIVGTISLFSMISYARSRCVNGTCVACFGLPGMLGTFLGAGLSDHVSTSIQLTVFGAVLLLAAFMMIRKAWAAPPRESAAMDASTADALTASPSRHPPAINQDSPSPTSTQHPFTWWRIVVMGGQGLMIGVLTGFVGVGGGFLIVPALVLLAGLPIRTAIGTSLTIITATSCVGFFKHYSMLTEQDGLIDVRTIIVFAIVGIAAGILGGRTNSRIDQRRLKQVFAVFLVLIGAFVILKETTM